MWFVRVPEGKTAKNRIHFDLWPTSATRDEQVQRAIDLGAVVLDDRRRADGAGWVVFADTEATNSVSDAVPLSRQQVRTDLSQLVSI
jgi:Glyoxalase-like domain